MLSNTGNARFFNGIAQLHNPATCCEVKVRDFFEARKFYAENLGFVESQLNEKSWQFSLGGNTIDCHLDEALGSQGKVPRVYTFKPGTTKPTPHCTLPLASNEFARLTRHLNRRSIKYSTESRSRLVEDPSGNVIEFSLSNDNLDRQSSWLSQRTGRYVVALLIVCLFFAWLLLR